MTVLRPADDPLEASTYTYVEVTPGEVSAAISLTAVAQWKPTPVAVNQAVGVVTEIRVAAGDEVQPGAILYSVNMRPVFIAEGTIPMYRDIGEGAEGIDVTQLQTLLTDLGFYTGARDGKAGSGTVRAIKAWQKSAGVEATGFVSAGDVVFVPTLPTRVALAPDVIVRGATLTGGEEMLSGLPTEPAFSIPVTENQAATLQTGIRVSVTSPEGGTWWGEVTDQTRDADTSTIQLGLRGVDGASVCAAECSQIPTTGESTLSARVITTEPVDGLTVPTAALVVSADGRTSVVDRTGTRLPVTVEASANGMSVIRGVDAETKVRVPAK
ncbi:peptidoglycan-binding domain-containing protein [Microbacterium phyllosphaerae]|uniref:peptidoglycan-binding domain-containing protein n=1 Tax=Microbacterium phyllosphaerae TaxID=124798 RepID=UPI001FC9E93C|nr:peptidoglycan-binding domain-containing protein [Microbacterium phyllosphaerae]